MAEKQTVEEAQAHLMKVEAHAHLRRHSRHAMAMALQTGDPKIIEAVKAQHEEEMKIVAASPHTVQDIDRAAQAVLDASGYVAPKES